MKLHRLFFPTIITLSLCSCDFSIKNITGITVGIEEKNRFTNDTFDLDDITATLTYDSGNPVEIKYDQFDSYNLTTVCYYPNNRNSGILTEDFVLNYEGSYEIEISYNPQSVYKYGCSGRGSFSVEKLYIAATSLNLESSSISLNKGTTQQINYSILPEETSSKVPTFHSNDTNIATVDETGMVTGIEEGQCIVTIQIDDIVKECLVTVTPSNITDYVFTTTDFSSENGQWNATVAGNSFDSRLNRGVCISEATTITSPISYNSILNIEFECASGGSSFSYFSSSCGSIETYIGDSKIGSGSLAKSNTSYRAIYPIEGLSGTVSLVIKPNESGNATIYIRSISITYQLNDIYPTSITLSGNNEIGIGESDKLSIDYNPSSTNHRNISWSSSNEDVLTVDIDGTIHGHKVGSATVTAKAQTANDYVSDTFTVNVIKIPVQSIELNSTSFDIYIGKTKKLVATVFPVNASNKNVSFASSNPNIATVDADGNITGISAGECSVICSSIDDKTITASCSVVVSEQPDLVATSMSYNMNNYIEKHYYELSAAPSVGTTNLLVIPVWFTDSSTYISSKDNVREDIKKAYFGTEEEAGWQSVKSFYENESNGKLTLSGCVSEWYSCGLAVKDFNYSSSSTNNGTKNLVVNAVNWYFNNHTSDSRSNYDADHNGYLDGVILIYGCPDYNSLNSNNFRANYGDNLWAYTYWLQSTSYKSVANPGPNAFFWASYDFMYSSGTYASKRTGKSTYGNGSTSYANVDTHTFIHEMGHIFGLEDYYDYSSYYTPAGGFSMQDYNVGGHDPLSCLLLGWADAYIPIDDCEIELEPFQSSHTVILLSPSWNEKNSPFDEYMLIELYTPTGLNEFDTSHRYSTSAPQGVSATGIRLWHVDARLVKYSNGGIASANSIYNYPVDNCDFVMSNTYYSSSTTTYISPLGRSYANYNILQLIRNDTREKYTPTDYFKEAALFKDGSSFNMTTYKNQFVNSGLLNSGNKLGWEFSVTITGSDDNAKATIVLKKS